MYIDDLFNIVQKKSHFTDVLWNLPQKGVFELKFLVQQSVYNIVGGPWKSQSDGPTPDA